MSASARKSHEDRTVKGTRVEARLTVEAKAIIEHAAHIEGVSTSDFIISHASGAAREIISAHERWSLDRAQSQAFAKALLNSPEPNEMLRRAAERYKAR